MEAKDYVGYDGLGLAGLVKRREVSPLELVETAIGLIEKHNPTLNGVVHKAYDQARAEAATMGTEGPFAGVPLLLKDILAAKAGLPLAQGSRLFEGYVDYHTSELTTRYGRAGFVVLGRTNAPEFGILPTTEPLAYGPARNPWNPGHSTGGSSGGSAAMVAAGCLPIAHANDGGGSIRIPASACGLVGLKPTRGRNPLGPDFGDLMGGFVCEHVVSRTVRDTAAALDATAGPDVGDPYWAPPPKRPYVDELTRPPARLKVAFSTSDFQGQPMHPECRRAVTETAHLLESLGHTVEEASPALPVDMVKDAFLALYATAALTIAKGAELMLGRVASPENVEPVTWASIERARSITGADYQIAVYVLQRVSRFIAQFFEGYDVVLTTTLTRPPARLGEIACTNPDLAAVMTQAADYTNTPFCNFTGQPAISLPLHWTDDGLPVGVHFAGRFGDEGTLIALAAELESARPWKDRHPPIWA